MAKKTTKKGAAHKRPSKARAAGKSDKIDPKTATLAQFREAAREYLRADENVQLYKKRRDAQKTLVKGYVETHAVDLDKGTRGYVDNAVKWLLVPGALRLDDDAGVAALQAAIAKAKGDAKRILQACIKPKIDKESYDNAKAVGIIDKKLQAACEKGQSFSIKWAHTDQVSCYKCHGVATRTAKFCSHCGADLTKAPEHLR